LKHPNASRGRSPDLGDAAETTMAGGGLVQINHADEPYVDLMRLNGADGTRLIAAGRAIENLRSALATVTLGWSARKLIA
jgi:hypothetical protein